MATLGSTFFDLIELYKRQDGQGNFVPIIEILNEMNPVLADAIAVECNKGTTHLHTVRSGLPEVSWGRLYKGIPNGKSGTAQVEDTTGYVEGLSTIDKRLLDLSTNEGAVRMGEAMAYLEAMSQQVSRKIFYGNTASDPEEFMGLAPRFNQLSAANGGQIVDAGGTGADNTSLWMVTWGDNQCQLLYPKGTQAGVNREDMGSQRLLDASGNAYYGMEEKFTWHCGLAVKDWRYVARVANIDVSDLQANTVPLYDHLRSAYYKLQSRRLAGGKMAIYCNTDVLESLDALATNGGSDDSFIRLTRKEIQGEEVLSYRGIPIRESDSLMNTEARVV
jgi:hypothetical protein